MSEPVRSLRSRDEVLKDHRTAEILTAARRVIGELGWHAASMERIAQAAGLAKGTLYLYFESKEALLERVHERGRDELLERSRAAVAGASDALGRLRAAAHAGAAHARENQAFFRALTDARVGTSKGRDDGGDLYADHLAAIFEDGCRSGELRPVDPARAARQLVYCVSGLVAERLLRAQPLPEAEDVEAMLDLFVHGVGSGGGA